jgi:hypothetical protein
MTNKLLIGAIASISVCAIGTTALAEDFPAGSYHAQDLSIVFDGKGKFEVAKGGTTEVSGTYIVQQGRVELTDVKGPWACTNSGQKKGTYVWSWNGTALTFIKVTDSCEERSKTLVPASWQLRN